MSSLQSNAIAKVSNNVLLARIIFIPLFLPSVFQLFVEGLQNQKILYFSSRVTLGGLLFIRFKYFLAHFFPECFLWTARIKDRAMLTFN